MMPAEMLDFVAASRAAYIAERVEAGEDPGEATKVADEQTNAMFPDGGPAPGHHLFRVEDDGQVVGSLWLGPQSSDTPRSLWVWDITIDESHRGRGIGTAAMLLAEEEARLDGATHLGLHVFAQNTVARHLYERLGYNTVSVRMSKAI
jgi:ribosomal protein S18 acetylase RimI-like enzyme